MSSTELIVFIVLAATVLVYVWRRAELSLAKHRSLAGHSRWSRRVAALVPFYEYDDAHFFGVDGASQAIADQRRGGFMSLAKHYATMFPKSAALTAGVEDRISDLRFTSAYRVPFQFSGHVLRHLRSGAFYERSDGRSLQDLDGNRLIDLSGSYGVNVFGYDFYKHCIESGLRRVADLGPVLGAYHPVVAHNVQRLCAISGLDEVSFHMSGTEAVMQAVRLARYHSRRRYLVRFCGAYHGWWGEVQPGIGNPTAASDTLTLADMSAATLRVLRHRRDIACVLVNPLQAMHPNRGAPTDSTLLGSGRRAHFDRGAYTDWLRQLRDLCSARGIALIFDEVFVGFRIAAGGAQEYFGIRADLVTYGKTVGGGLPIGVLCGKAGWMRRFRTDRPADICFARGTFNSQPHVMGAMYEFLRQYDTPRIQALYVGLDDTWNQRAAALNRRFEALTLPLRVVNFSSIWTVLYARPSRYNWMYQFYLRAHGVALSWVGTGRLIFSLDFTPAEFQAAADAMIAAAAAMQKDGWWSCDVPLTNRQIGRQVLREMLHVTWRRFRGRSARSRNSMTGAL